MKKIVLQENQIPILKESVDDMSLNKLPKYVYRSVKEHNTSLGDNPAFPPSHDYNYDYKILKIRFNEILETLNELQLPTNENEAENLLYKLMQKAVEMEKPFRPQLNKLAYNTVYALFAVPNETINLTCELVDKVTPKNALRIVPEDDSKGDVYTFNDVDEINEVDDIVKQRRFINSLIQGYSLIVSTDYQLYNDFYSEKGLGDLIDLYEKINALNDYLSFVKKEKINKKNQSLISYVEVHLGHRDDRTIIKSQGLIFPYLLRETVRGFMELFSSHGLPEDNDKAQEIISMSDFTMAEPWDIRFGKVLWEKAFPHDLDSTKIPYLFADYSSLPPNEFFKISQNLLAHTKKGQEYINDELNNIDHDVEYNKFLQNIQQKNIETSMITDGYMTPDDLDNYTIEEEGDLEENQEDEDKYDDFANNNQNKHLIIFDDCDGEYSNLNDLINGVRNHKLLIHARRVEDGTLEALQYGLEPEVGETITKAYGDDYYELALNQHYYETNDDSDDYEVPEEEWKSLMQPFVFASDDLTWCHDSRNGVIFVRSEGFTHNHDGEYLGYFDNDEGIEKNCGYATPDVSLNDMPIYIESNDYVNPNTVEVVAVLNLNAPIQESVSKKGINENQEDEYASQDMISGIKKYLNMSYDDKIEDRLFRNSGLIYNFIKEGGYEYYFTNDELNKLKYNDTEGDPEENIDILKNHKNVLNSFLRYAENIDYEDNQNANDVFDYEKDIDINKEWLIHFTTCPECIAEEGFTAGTYDVEKLAVTARDSKKMGRGYDFAFMADDVTNYEAECYCGTDSNDWGAVMFHANAVQAYHGGDMQHQVIFWGPYAFDIIPIYHGDISYQVDYDNEDVYSKHRGSIYDTWYIKDDVTDRVLFSDENIENIVSWVENNFYQYKNRLNRSKKINNDMYYPKSLKRNETSDPNDKMYK